MVANRNETALGRIATAGGEPISVGGTFLGDPLLLNSASFSAAGETASPWGTGGMRP
jgi:hypothetical protein